MDDFGTVRKTKEEQALPVPQLEDMGEESGLGTKSVPPKEEEKKYYDHLIEKKLK